MASRKLAMKPLADFEKVDPKTCSICGHGCIRGDLSSVANFGVTREPHFVTSYGWMQVKYDRATAVDAYMCLSCGHVSFYGRSPLAVLDPIERQQHLRAVEPELDRKMLREEKRRKELEKKGLPVDSDEHVGV
ncbi:MAG: hypothetical protein M3R04_05655 [bacterium]|nr:hypothetical protein [bacterium]